MDSTLRFGFIGGGKLASSVIRGLLRNDFCAPQSILVSEPFPPARDTLASELGVNVTTENTKVVERTAEIFLGVKPQFVLPILREMGQTLSGKMVVSFAAGIRLESMEAATPARILRVMTNTPSAIGRAATAFARGQRSTEQDVVTVRGIFGAIGTVVEVNDAQIDAVTALAGSGPAFVYSVIEALAAGAEKMGLAKDAALKLAAQTALGAAELALTSGKSPNELRAMVVTPGGTTAAGLAAMEQRAAKEALIAAVEAAAARGAEMSRELAS